MEPGERAAPGHRQRGLDVRDFTLDHLRRLGVAAAVPARWTCSAFPTVLVPPNPGNVSAFGLLTVDVKNDYVQTHVALADALDPAPVAAAYDDLTARAAEALTARGVHPGSSTGSSRTADLRYFGQAFEVRVPVPDGDLDAPALDGVATRFHAEHRGLYGYDFCGDPTSRWSGST